MQKNKKHADVLAHDAGRRVSAVPHGNDTAAVVIGPSGKKRQRGYIEIAALRSCKQLIRDRQKAYPFRFGLAERQR
jgi:hypothetical protein